MRNAKPCDSNFDLDLTNGHVFRFIFTWYGFGAIKYEVIAFDPDGRQFTITVHTVRPTKETSIKNPNLPIRAELSSGNTDGDLKLYVSGRQYSVLGGYEPNRRVTGARRLEEVTIGSTPTPLLSVRRKPEFLSVGVKLEGLDIMTNQPLLLQIRTE